MLYNCLKILIKKLISNFKHIYSTTNSNNWLKNNKGNKYVKKNYTVCMFNGSWISSYDKGRPVV